MTLQVTNKKLSGIVIHKIDSATGEGIYGVKFVLYDANKKPIGEYTSDDEGYSDTAYAMENAHRFKHQTLWKGGQQWKYF